MAMFCLRLLLLFAGGYFIVRFVYNKYKGLDVEAKKEDIERTHEQCCEVKKFKAVHKNPEKEAKTVKDFIK